MNKVCSGFQMKLGHSLSVNCSKDVNIVTVSVSLNSLYVIS